jgi:hypothetical protein
MADERAERIARNEARFREINDRLARDLAEVVEGAEELLPFVCECGLRTCAQPVRLSIGEYRRVRADRVHFAVVPGHEIEDVEDVVERGDRYVVIRKHEATWPIVTAS